jgi:hypothetical protein
MKVTAEIINVTCALYLVDGCFKDSDTIYKDHPYFILLNKAQVWV